MSGQEEMQRMLGEMRKKRQSRGIYSAVVLDEGASSGTSAANARAHGQSFISKTPSSSSSSSSLRPTFIPPKPGSLRVPHAAAPIGSDMAQPGKPSDGGLPVPPHKPSTFAQPRRKRGYTFAPNPEEAFQGGGLTAQDAPKAPSAHASLLAPSPPSASKPTHRTSTRLAKPATELPAPPLASGVPSVSLTGPSHTPPKKPVGKPLPLKPPPHAKKKLPPPPPPKKTIKKKALPPPPPPKSHVIRGKLKGFQQSQDKAAECVQRFFRAYCGTGYILQKWFRTVESWSSHNDSRPLRHRMKILAEIVSSEKVYVSNLFAARELFIEPLTAESDDQSADSPPSDFLTKEDVEALFANWSDLLMLHTSLLTQFETCFNLVCLGSLGSFGDIFTQVVQYFPIYITYVNNFNTALSTAEQVLAHPRVAAYLASCRQHPAARNLDLHSYLIMPVQRVPRYELLLKDLCKHTVEEHLDHAKLREAYNDIKKVAVDINERKREAERHAKLVESLQSFNESARRVLNRMDIVKPGRAVLRHGLVTKISRRRDTIVSKKSGLERYLFLLSDTVLVQTKDGDLELCVDLADLTVKDLPDKPGTVWDLNVEGHPDGGLTLSCTEKQEWLDEIEEAQESLFATQVDTFTWSYGPEQDYHAAPRFGHTMVSVPVASKAEGDDGTEPENDETDEQSYDVYVYGGMAVYPIHLDEEGEVLPPASDRASAVIEYDTVMYSDLYCLDAVTNQWSAPPTTGSEPSPRHSHAACVIGDALLDAAQILIFGGDDGSQRLNDLYIYEIATQQWREVLSGDSETPSSWPCARSCHTMAALDDWHVFVHGGRDEQNEFLGDLWMLDVKHVKWTQLCTIPQMQKMLGDHYAQERMSLMRGEDEDGPRRPRKTNILGVRGTAPSGRAWHSMTALGRSLYVFGGYSKGKAHSTFHVLRITREETFLWEEVEPKGPGAADAQQGRNAHAAIAVGKRLFVMGGAHPLGFYDDLIVFDAESGVWTAPHLLHRPGPIAFHQLCNIGNKLVTFGGKAAPGRGIMRPGDTLFLNAEVASDHQKNLEMWETRANTAGEEVRAKLGPEFTSSIPAQKKKITDMAPIPKIPSANELAAQMQAAASPTIAGMDRSSSIKSATSAASVGANSSRLSASPPKRTVSLFEGIRRNSPLRRSSRSSPPPETSGNVPPANVAADGEESSTMSTLATEARDRRSKTLSAAEIAGRVYGRGDSPGHIRGPEPEPPKPAFKPGLRKPSLPPTGVRAGPSASTSGPAAAHAPSIPHTAKPARPSLPHKPLPLPGAPSGGSGRSVSFNAAVAQKASASGAKPSEEPPLGIVASGSKVPPPVAAKPDKLKLGGAAQSARLPSPSGPLGGGIVAQMTGGGGGLGPGRGTALASRSQTVMPRWGGGPTSSGPESNRGPGAGGADGVVDFASMRANLKKTQK